MWNRIDKKMKICLNDIFDVEGKDELLFSDVRRKWESNEWGLESVNEFDKLYSEWSVWSVIDFNDRFERWIKRSGMMRKVLIKERYRIWIVRGGGVVGEK